MRYFYSLFQRLITIITFGILLLIITPGTNIAENSEVNQNTSSSTVTQIFLDSTFCYPNPARDLNTTVKVYAPQNGSITIRIYNENDKPIVKVTSYRSSGTSLLYEWNLQKVVNGVYYAHISIEYDGGGSDREIVKIGVLR